MKDSTTFLKILKHIGIAVFWVGVWYIVAALINKELFLPYPHTVAARFLTLCRTADFWKTTAVSLVRIIEGFLGGVAVGSALALLTNYIRGTKAVIAPAIRAVRATPVVSFILLAFLWLDNDTIPVVIALLMVVPIIWENLTAGFANLNPDLNEMARVFALSKTKTFFKVILPQLMPHLYSGCLVSLGLAWKSGIAAEVISYPKIAIGQAMNDAKMTLETADVLVWTVVVVVLSLILESFFKILIKKGGRRT